VFEAVRNMPTALRPWLRLTTITYQNGQNKTDWSIFGHVVNKHSHAQKIWLCAAVGADLISTHIKRRTPHPSRQ
jgi:hypothetical protein